jgi:hypothetical protein
MLVKKSYIVHHSWLDVLKFGTKLSPDFLLHFPPLVSLNPGSQRIAVTWSAFSFFNQTKAIKRTS